MTERQRLLLQMIEDALRGVELIATAARDAIAHLGPRQSMVPPTQDGEVTFYVDGRPVSKNATISCLIDALIDGLQIPATSTDYVIDGEGDLRMNGSAIEVVYDWDKAIPYDYPAETGGGVFTLVQPETPPKA